MNEIRVLGVDLGKDTCSVAGFDGRGTVLLRRRMRRDSVLKSASKLPACVMAMEGVAVPIISVDSFENMATMFG